MKKEYVADLSALCGAERFTFSEGKAKGIDAVRLYNGKLDLKTSKHRGNNQTASS